jgi:hypothetical protein
MLNSAGRRAMSWRSIAIAVCVSSALGLASCSSGSAPPPPPSDPWTREPLSNAESAEQEIEGTDDVLDGAFEIVAPAPASAPVAYVFTSMGAFSRTVRVSADGDGTKDEAGTYLVDTRGRLVLFVERSGIAVYASAESEAIGFQRLDADTLALTVDGVEARYRRTGPAPSKAQGGPSAE